MSELLMVHRIPRSVTPLGDWLAEVADRVTLVTGDEAFGPYRASFPHVYAVPGYSDNPAVDVLLDEVCRQRPISTLVHVTEDDILRCARARDRHGIPGLRYSEALPWRDKYLMKQRVRAAGVAVPDFAVPRDAGEALAFAGRAGYPVVVKPRTGFASHGVEPVRDPERLAELAAGWDPDDVLLESFVPGEVYHVDGFMHEGAILYVSASRYINNCLSFQDSVPLGSVQLDRDDPEFARLAELAGQVVAGLPPVDFSPFHLEVFADGERLVFCEIACRLGGAHIMETLTYATGVNPAQLWIRHQAGLEHGPGVRLGDSGKSYGWLLVPPRRGRLTGIREPEGHPYIKDFIVKTAVPRDFDGAHGSTDSYLAFVVEGDNSAQAEQRLRACIRLADTITSWEVSDDEL